MTTITKALEGTARAAIAARTEALFRESGALRDGHFLLKSGRHSDAYLEKFAVLSDPAATSELCAFWAGQHRGADDRPTVDLVAGPTTGGVILAFETGRQLGTRAIFAEEVKGDGPPRREFRRGLPNRAGRARPARRRHPHDRRLAAGDDPRGRGRGRRDRRVRRARRPIRWPERARLAVDGPALRRSTRSGSSTCRRTSPGPRPARAARRASPSMPQGAPARLREATAASADGDRRTVRPRWSSVLASAWPCLFSSDLRTPTSRTTPDVASPVGRRRDRGRFGGPVRRPRVHAADERRLRVHVRARPARERDRILAEPPRRAPGIQRADPGLVPRRGRRARRLSPRGRAGLGSYFTVSRAAVSSSSPKISSNAPWTMPSRSTT